MLTFTKNITNPNRIGANKTYSDSSSRTELLKRVLREKKSFVPKNKVDVNGVQHQVRRLRNSGGIPKKCNLPK
jgi:hypothetical protein